MQYGNILRDAVEVDYDVWLAKNIGEILYSLRSLLYFLCRQPKLFIGCELTLNLTAG